MKIVARLKGILHSVKEYIWDIYDLHPGPSLVEQEEYTNSLGNTMPMRPASVSEMSVDNTWTWSVDEGKWIEAPRLDPEAAPEGMVYDSYINQYVFNEEELDFASTRV